MERTEELLSEMNGQLHELVGDHREFKRETLSRLDSLEHDVKDIPDSRRTAICGFISIASGILALAGMLGIKMGGSL
ncbi:MAG: hypothetical protein K6G00_05350 [Treponema sp.]|nr:hypothetical protein [Treponema sp.]